MQRLAGAQGGESRCPRAAEGLPSGLILLFLPPNPCCPCSLHPDVTCSWARGSLGGLSTRLPRETGTNKQRSLDRHRLLRILPRGRELQPPGWRPDAAHSNTCTCRPPTCRLASSASLLKRRCSVTLSSHGELFHSFLFLCQVATCH